MSTAMRFFRASAICRAFAIAGSVLAVGAAVLLSTHATAQQGAMPASSANEPAVDRLVLAAHVHGLSYTEARRLGTAAIPRLLAILDDPNHAAYWVNALVALGFLESPDVVDALVAFEQRTASASDEASRRAHRAIPFALGAIAANRDDAKALDHLRTAVTVKLERLDDASAQSARDRDLLEQAILGLAVAARTEAMAFIDSVKSSSALSRLPDDRRRRLTDVIEQAGQISAEILQTGRAAYFSPRSPRSDSVAAHAEGLPPSLQVGARRHAQASYANPQFDADLAAATELLFRRDTGCGGADVTCPVTFSRSGDVGTFGSPGDGLDIVTTATELQAVFAVGGARVKYVSELDYCGGYNVSIIGCAPQPGSTMVLQTNWPGTSVFAHEYGHNMGLDHRDGCDNNLMNSTLSSPIQGVVDQLECNAFGGGGVTLTLDLSFAGNGSGHVEVSPAGTSCESSCSVEIPYSANVQLTLVPNAGSIAAGCGGSCAFPMSNPAARTIRFLTKRTMAGILSAILLPDEGDLLFRDGFDPPGR